MRPMTHRQFALGGKVESTPAVLACLFEGYAIPASTWNRVDQHIGNSAGQKPTTHPTG